MIVQCKKCNMWFEDVYRDTICPHLAFYANDGHNNFAIHFNAYLDSTPPDKSRIFEAHNES